MKQHSEIAIIGRACRLPGANSVPALWRLLQSGTCAVTRIPSDRWSLERFGHPRPNERGKSYTWAAGVLDDIWGFDAAAFGLSPREAEQMDPQQRLLLELTWEALEDAGLRPSSLTGTETGVFVGASTTDHGNSKLFDIAATDGYFATGNAASILANRISYVYDLNGPSFTVDTACSSSLVAFDAAVQALQSGRIETAIVGGVSILTTPFQFVNFSQASMLSRIGLCQAFSAKADGYVRSEGAGVLVLRSSSGLGRGDRVHARVIGTRINSDGRTNGIALPSTKRQAQLLDQLYRESGADLDRLAFVEAHGTGTPVGDPVEAAAIGEVLGQRRTSPLPIGSIKSNIGHTEAAAGIAGLMKAMLALEHDLLPATLHCEQLNPHIDFERLNLAVAAVPRPLDGTRGKRLAGISSYGFGGTNAHVILADAAPAPAADAGAAPEVLMLSAHSRSALAALASAYADRMDADGAAAVTLAAAANWHRDVLEERLIVPLASHADVPRSLRSFARAAEEPGADVTVGTAVGRDASVAFVYSGNGGQWAGMGRAAYAGSPAFRSRFDAVDRAFRARSGWSLAEAMNGEDIAERLVKTSVAQPLIYAIQSASTYALGELGLRPETVFGHSVGEVAAAEAAGILDLETAVKVIYFRSLHQELAFETGGMAVLIGSGETAERIAADVPGLTIAAYNSPRAHTFSGSLDALGGLTKAARGLKARAQKLDIAYPFHSPLIATIEAPLLADLGTLSPRAGLATFVSTVTGAELAGDRLDARYWWRNVREPVLFAQAVETAGRRGNRIFVEIGPSPILLSHINDTLGSGEATIATLGVLDRKQQAGDPFRKAVAQALVRGAAVAPDIAFGGDPGAAVTLPSYPWQRKTYRLGDTSESIAFLTPRPWHPLVGARYATDQLEWHAQLDTALVPALADHVVDGHVLLPGAAFAEMALAVARDWLGTETAAIADFEIQQPMILASTASRDVRCRVQPVTGTIEIMSRARLGPATWQVHAVAKILHQTTAAEAPPAWEVPAEAEVVTGEAVYALAAASGLTYGPAFRLLDSARRVGPDAIVVDLIDMPADPRFGLDPAAVDACFHGLVLLYAKLAVRGRLKPYVPVGAGEVKLFRPGVPIVRAHIAVVRSDERTIIVNFTLLDAQDQVVASLHRLRFQAMSAFRSGERPIDLVGQTSVLAAEPLATPEGASVTVADVVATAKALDALHPEAMATAPDYVLLEGWATATAYGLCEVLADNSLVNLQASVTEGRLPEHLVDWAGHLLSALQKSGLVHRAATGDFAVTSGAELPDPKDILRALAADHPERSAELLLAARTGAIVDAIAAGTYDRSLPLTATAVDSFDFGGQAAMGSASTLAALLAGLEGAWPKTRALRILQVGDGPLTARVARFCKDKDAELTLVDPDRRRLERARLHFDKSDNIAFAPTLDKLAPGSFDLVVSAQSLHRIATDPAAWTSLADAMAPGAILVAIEPESSVFRTLVVGLQAAAAEPAEAPVAQAFLGSEATWTRALSALNLADIVVLPTRGTDFGLLCVGQKSTARSARAVKGDALVIGRGEGMGEAAAALATMLKFSGMRVASRAGSAAMGEDGDVPETVIVMAGAADGRPALAQFVERCLELRALAGSIGSRKVTLWIVCPGGIRAEAARDHAVDAGMWAFGRTLANEHPALDVRLIDLVPGLAPDVAARRLRDVILSGTAETEIILDAATTRVVRFEKLPLEMADPLDPDETVVRLVKGENSSLDRLQWAVQHRRAPGPGEVEIAVEAAGLNFRDVMWGLSILPEEILEDGYAGATLGLECAGRVVRVGADVGRFRVGDPVLAFAKAALSTHVTVSADVVAVIPGDMSAAAAATVPVAFLTAYYGLVRCARLAEEEWVLIHGGAGGVGLAAMQVARWRGARVIATAGSAERRDLLTALGAEHVFDSRSNQFVDDIRRVTGKGVDVVLNSLSGEAMERSIAVLRPFGRFVELGKRDYVANTHIGLKPFRRNLSYFGVDLDQLILKDDTTGQDLFNDVIGLFADGALTPLPYRVFEADEAIDAFRVMQRSGHIGKIVITPPALPRETASAPTPFDVAPDKVHLITGGLGGFGIETAHWLVDRGARHLVLVGRSGTIGPEAREALDGFAAAGVTVTLSQLNITDEAAVGALFATFGGRLPALGGVIHAAAVIDDSIIANLTEAKLEKVLAAKVTGAEILDRLTRRLTLDYFILYSSATTVIGNPGQGAYVAANGFLEGLARARRQDGLPAVAVAWGAIEDVGILARSGSATIGLLARSGVLGMTARNALNHLADALPHTGTRPDRAVVILASVNWSNAREHLPVLQSRSFGQLMHGTPASESGAKGKIRVRDLIEQEGAAAASKQVLETILEEIARILRLPRDDVSRNKPLMDIGLDSLMAVELGMGLEERFELEAPLSTSAGAMTVAELAEYIVGTTAGEGGAGQDQTSESLAWRHLDADIRKDLVDALPGRAGGPPEPRREQM